MPLSITDFHIVLGVPTVSHFRSNTHKKSNSDNKASIWQLLSDVFILIHEFKMMILRRSSIVSTENQSNEHLIPNFGKHDRFLGSPS
jgi:hypothetical protein